ncbi:MAG: hypothetical protein LH619_11855 [Chitinophagaceae bacterium]|nr:hypothetical protein [Chitinophagaceae bacterium]
MEVHAHTHTPRKKWTHYFWEFLMLFLAVFCGFLAEYQLEHKIERDRAKELAISFYEELKNDSATVLIKSQNRIRQENALGYLMYFIKDSSLNKLSKTFSLNFLYGITFRTPSIFEPRTVVLEQLKNSGSLRYFKNTELQKLIGELTVAIQNINNRQSYESVIRNQYLDPWTIMHNDIVWWDKIIENSKLPFDIATKNYEMSDAFLPFNMTQIDKIDRQNTFNMLGFYRNNAMHSTRQIHFQKYIDVNAALLKVLRKEYRIKN